MKWESEEKIWSKCSKKVYRGIVIASLKVVFFSSRTLVINIGKVLIFLENHDNSSPRAESARAVTGRRCPQSGEGEDFLTRQPGFFLQKRPYLGNEKSKNHSQGVK